MNKRLAALLVRTSDRLDILAEDLYSHFSVARYGATQGEGYTWQDLTARSEAAYSAARALA